MSEQLTALRILPDFFRELVGAEDMAGGGTSLRLLTVHGDSMEPTLASADCVVVDTLDTQVVWPTLYCIDTGLGPIVQRLEPIPGWRPRRYRASYDNPIYDDTELSGGALKCLGRVVGIVKRM